MGEGVVTVGASLANHAGRNPQSSPCRTWTYTWSRILLTRKICIMFLQEFWFLLAILENVLLVRSKNLRMMNSYGMILVCFHVRGTWTHFNTCLPESTVADLKVVNPYHVAAHQSLVSPSSKSDSQVPMPTGTKEQLCCRYTRVRRD